jgi:hypothetical protein
MTILASILFIVALAASIFTIAATILQNLPRILHVIEHRDVDERPIRKITIGKMVATGAQKTAALPVLRPRMNETMRTTGMQKTAPASRVIPLAA